MDLTCWMIITLLNIVRFSTNKFFVTIFLYYFSNITKLLNCVLSHFEIYFNIFLDIHMLRIWYQTSSHTKRSSLFMNSINQGYAHRVPQSKLVENEYHGSYLIYVNRNVVIGLNAPSSLSLVLVKYLSSIRLLNFFFKIPLKLKLF